ncbi:SHOCT domain-containing protein [Youngiibacter multivorans]|uniref:SHOCT domain-containing protein n=1 Tax=Youngiibacter multivorans TaxID=937251 RepID=A0ABS4G794_9CLOT|nr:SHOCT domain-containing protein [Youngiibacter multivorans]MBP1920408.1 hypothetical protein [Youngiibacter multivorans]
MAREADLVKAEMKRIHDEKKEMENVPKDATVVTYKFGTGYLLRGTNYMWLSEGNLCFYPRDYPHLFTPESSLHFYCLRIPLKDLEYFSSEGEIFRESKISGGGGGGLSIGGAVVGGVVAGGIGALLGSRKAVKPVESKIITHDEREVILYYNINHELKTMSFSKSSIGAFEKLIPEKSFVVVDSVKKMDIIDEKTIDAKTTSIPDKIRDLAMLLKEGLITEDEFTEKKKELLSKMT